jgi:hypothetical protein
LTLGKVARALIVALMPCYPLLAVLIAGYLGDLIVQGWTSNQPIIKAFASTPEYHYFAVSSAAVTGLSVIAVIVTWNRFREARKNAPESTRQAASVYLFIIIAVLVTPRLVGGNSGGNSSILTLDFMNVRTAVLGLVVLAGCFPSFAGMMMWKSGLSDALADNLDKGMEYLQKMHYDLEVFLGSSAVLITGGIVALCLMSRGMETVAAITVQDPASGRQAPLYHGVDAPTLSLLIMFGLFCAAFIGYAFIPAYQAYGQGVKKLIKCHNKISEKGHPGMAKEWLEEEEKLKDMIHPRSQVLSRILAAIGVLSPLIASLLSALIPVARG